IRTRERSNIPRVDRQSLVGRFRQQLPQVQPQADFMPAHATLRTARFDDSRMRDIRACVARNVDTTAAVQRKRVRHLPYIRCPCDNANTSLSQLNGDSAAGAMTRRNQLIGDTPKNATELSTECVEKPVDFSGDPALVKRLSEHFSDLH